MVETSRASWIAGEQRQLGKYELFHRLATGGMAEIYLARAAAIEGFEKLVVVKRILPQHAENEAFIRMFLAEARLAATLHHPNIVQVYDIGEQDGTYFFAMEHVHGLDLRRLLLAAIDAGRWPPLQHILHIVRGVCAGLHYAHEKKDGSGTPLGIVHRDISPSNVLVTFDGGVKVVDFGIAKASNVSTSSGTLKGKLAYMSPEQCRSETLDRRSDVYSIGTLLWELTTGRRLFKAQTELELMKRVAQGDVLPPSAVRPDIPRALEEIILKALSVDVEQRYGSARALQLDLEDFAHDAHLPLSDARLQPYVRELCADQISKLDELLAAYHRTTPPSVTERRVEPEPAEAPPHDGGAAQTADMGELATATYRSSQVPGGMAASGGGARRTSWLAVSVVGMAVAAGAVGWNVLRTDDELAEGRAVPAAVAHPPDDAEAAVEAATPAVDVAHAPSEPVAPDITTTTGDEDGSTTAEPESPSTTAAPRTDASPTPSTTPRRPRKPRRSTTRPSSGKSSATPPTKARKPEWDPKAAPPPGL